MAEKEPTSRELKAIQTKNRIYETALELIQRDGFDNVAIGDICKAAQISVGLFYYYFPSKNDILFELYKRADDYFNHDIKNSLKTDDYPGKIREYMNGYITFVNKDGIDLIRNLYIPTNTFFIEKGRGMQMVLERVIREGQAAGQIDSRMTPEESVTFIFTILRGIIFDWCLYNGGYDLPEKAQPFIEMVVSHFTLNDCES